MKLNRALLQKPKFQKLILKCGDRHRALGILAELFILAQDYWKNNRNPIPQAELIDADLPLETLNRLGFLVKEVEGYYMAGSEEVFARLTPSELGKLSAQSENHHALRGPDGRFVSKDELSKMSEDEIEALKAHPRNQKRKKSAAEIDALSRDDELDPVDEMKPQEEIAKVQKTKKRNTSGKAPKKAKRKPKEKKPKTSTGTPMAHREELFAYMTNYTEKKLHFTRHYKASAAERHYGDLSRHYKGSDASDYDLITLSRKELEEMLLKGEILVDWKKRVIYNDWDEKNPPVQPHEIFNGMRIYAGKFWQKYC